MRVLALISLILLPQAKGGGGVGVSFDDKVLAVIPDDVKVTEVRFSPDGRQVAYKGYKNGKCLVGVNKAQQWNSRGHFFAAAAEAMRRILIDQVRRKRSQRQGGARCRCELSDGDLIDIPLNDELIDLDEALAKLSSTDPQAAELVKLRVFAGMTIEEVAQVQGTSPRTVKRNWVYARAWLGRELAAYDQRKS